MRVQHRCARVSGSTESLCLRWRDHSDAARHQSFSDDYGTCRAHCRRRRCRSAQTSTLSESRRRTDGSAVGIEYAERLRGWARSRASRRVSNWTCTSRRRVSRFDRRPGRRAAARGPGHWCREDARARHQALDDLARQSARLRQRSTRGRYATAGLSSEADAGVREAVLDSWPQDRQPEDVPAGHLAGRHHIRVRSLRRRRRSAGTTPNRRPGEVWRDLRLGRGCGPVRQTAEPRLPIADGPRAESADGCSMWYAW